MEKQKFKMPLWKLLIITNVLIVIALSLMFVITSLISKGRIDYSNTRLSIEEYKQKYPCKEIVVTICGFNSIGMRSAKHYTVSFYDNGHEYFETIASEPCYKRVGREYCLLGTKYKMLVKINADSTVTPLVVEFDKPVFPEGEKQTYKCKLIKVKKDNQWYIRVFYQWCDVVRIGAIPSEYYDFFVELSKTKRELYVDCYKGQKYMTYINLEATLRGTSFSIENNEIDIPKINE